MNAANPGQRRSDMVLGTVRPVVLVLGLCIASTGCGEAGSERALAAVIDVEVSIWDCNQSNDQSSFSFTIRNDADVALTPLAIAFEGDTDRQSGEVLLSGEKAFEPSTTVPPGEARDFRCAHGVSFHWPSEDDSVGGDVLTYGVRASLSFTVEGETRVRSASATGALTYSHAWDNCDRVFIPASDCHVYP